MRAMTPWLTHNHWHMFQNMKQGPNFIGFIKGISISWDWTKTPPKRFDFSIDWCFRSAIILVVDWKNKPLMKLLNRNPEQKRPIDLWSSGLFPKRSSRILWNQAAMWDEQMMLVSSPYPILALRSWWVISLALHKGFQDIRFLAPLGPGMARDDQGHRMEQRTEHPTDDCRRIQLRYTN